MEMGRVELHPTKIILRSLCERRARDQLVREDSRSQEIIKPLIVGDDVRKYEVNFRDEYVIFTRRGITIDRYPAIQRHLSAFYDDLVPKATASDRRGRKPGKYKWYEIQDTTDYFMEFDKPKIVYPEIAMEPRFAMDVEGIFYPLKTVFLIPALEPYLVAILNSN